MQDWWNRNSGRIWGALDAALGVALMLEIVVILGLIGMELLSP